MKGFWLKMMLKTTKDATDIYKTEMDKVCKMSYQMIVSEGDFIKNFKCQEKYTC